MGLGEQAGGVSEMDPCSGVSRQPFGRMRGTALPHPSCSQGQRRPLFQGDRRAGSSPEPSGPALKEAPILPPGPAQPLQRAGRGAVGLGCLQPTSSLPTLQTLFWVCGAGGEDPGEAPRPEETAEPPDERHGAPPWLWGAPRWPTLDCGGNRK